MVESSITIRVRYSETDRMGYVHHGIYPQYYEMGRTEQLRERNFSYKQLEELGIMLPVHSMNIKYHRPVHYDELLTLKTILVKRPSIRLEFKYEIYNESGELVNEAESILIFVDANTRRPIRPPQFFDTLYPEFA